MKQVIENNSKLINTTSEAVKKHQKIENINIPLQIHKEINTNQSTIRNSPKKIIVVKEDTYINPCIICFDNSSNGVFLSCGHGGVCVSCCKEIW